MGTDPNERTTPEYLAQLLKDKKQIQSFPNLFTHTERLLDDEVNRVRGNLFHMNSASRADGTIDIISGSPDFDLDLLPEPIGSVITLQEKLFVPTKNHPDFNFVGRILGPRGMTAKQLEQDTGCKIMVRGIGSMRDKKKEEQNRGKSNWEHLTEDLHVLITVEDTRNRCEPKLAKAVKEINKLLVPAPEGEDNLKKKQLLDLAIMNGTYRDVNKIPQLPRFFNPQMFSPGVAAQVAINAAMHRSQLAQAQAQAMAVTQGQSASNGPAGHPLVIAPRMLSPATLAYNPVGPPTIGDQTVAAANNLMFQQYDPYYASLAASQSQTTNNLLTPEHYGNLTSTSGVDPQNVLGAPYVR